MTITEALQLALQHLVAGRHDEAASIYAKVLQVAPGNFDALYHLSVILHRAGRQREALALIDNALAVNQSAAALIQRAGVLVALERRVDAAAAFQSALVLAPESVEARLRLANVLIDLDRPMEAEDLLRGLPGAQRERVEATAMLGIALINQSRYPEAEPLLRRWLKARPGEPLARVNLGIALFYQGNHAESHRLLRGVLEQHPDLFARHSPLVFCLSCDGGFTPQEYLQVVRRFGVAVRAGARPFRAWRRAPGDASASPLRVGLVSGDLGHHPVGFFLEGILPRVDVTRVELYAYSCLPREDEVNARLRSCMAGWRDIYGMTDEAAAQCIHDDGIDVLIDLAGHTARNRLPLFAWKPAPVQVTWLGYFASTGIAEIDWILTDPVAAPPSEAGQFSERNWPLPETRLCFSPPSAAPDVSALPALRNGHVTFGSFQNMSKISDAVLALWGRTLAAVPGSRLRLQNGELARDAARETMTRRMSAAGIDCGRVTFAGHVPREAYLASHAEVDIILDTFPFHGGTTTCEALWMGVPTLTISGNTLLSRQGESLLVNAGLPGWVAVDADAFVRRAIALAADLPALAALRAGLREQVRVSPLFDGPRFARHFAEAMHGLWRASAPPTGMPS